MPKIIFKFDKEKDLFNIWETCNKENRWFNHQKFVPSVLVEICKGKKFDGCKNELERYRKKMHNSGFIEPFVKAMQKSWDKINDEYFERLEKIMKTEICFKEITAYITTVTRCPYEYNLGNPWFMISFFRDTLHALAVCGHEIMHIQFHNTYWEKIEQKIGKEKTADLKEALTVLLNLEFRDLWFVDDLGYESHKELRKFIEKEWKKEKDFEILLEKCVNYLKK